MTLQFRSFIFSLAVHLLTVTGVFAASLIIPQTRTIMLDLSLGQLNTTTAQSKPAPALHSPAPRQERIVTPVEKSEEAVPIKQDMVRDIQAPSSPQVVGALQEVDGNAAFLRSQESARAGYISAQFALIRDKILKRLVYPIVARKMGWTGRVVVSFTVREDGSAEDISVAESSGFPILDQNALDAVKASCPLPRPPVRTALMMPVLYTLK
jgi:protein TonB